MNNSSHLLLLPITPATNPIIDFPARIINKKPWLQQKPRVRFAIFHFALLF